jgi:hypothetical protein
MQHIIKKQVISLAINKKSGVFRMQQAMSAHYRNKVLPVLENIFNELSHDDEMIHIDHLEINLGEVSEDEINRDDWGEDIRSTIKEQLYAQIGQARERKQIGHEAKAIGICRQWLFYMQNGYLPWNTLQVNEAWYNQVLEALAADYNSVTELRGIIKQQPAVSHRIVWQHSEKFLIQLVTILAPEDRPGLAKVINGLQQMFSRSGEPAPTGTQESAYKVKLWERLIFLSAGLEKGLTPKRLVEEVRKINDITIGSGELRVESIDEEGLFVQYAGIVLIHPFLSTLFKRLQWVKEGKFEDDQSKQKALHLLHYAATGREEAEEYELVVPKILCNWPLAMPIERDVELNKNELDETDRMLIAVIEQWPVLQNTSADGLREGFLQRKGKYFKRNDKRYLQIESASIDVLLDQLPWNMGIIKLPWMKDMLWVEWR